MSFKSQLRQAGQRLKRAAPGIAIVATLIAMFLEPWLFVAGVTAMVGWLVVNAVKRRRRRLGPVTLRD